MKLKKNDLCNPCRKIHPIMGDGYSSNISIEEMLDGKGYSQGFGYVMMNHAILIYLKENGGCSRCISLFECATNPDEEEGFNKAAEMGATSAQIALGASYAQGSGVPRDLEKAVYWFTKAAELGDNVAQCELGNMYDSGTGVRQNYEKANYWLAKAAEQGNAIAQMNLATNYADGNGIKSDFEKANYWFDKAAEQGFAYAQFKLGLNLAMGRGVKKDLERAINLLSMAAEQGDENAKGVLASLGIE